MFLKMFEQLINLYLDKILTAYHIHEEKLDLIFTKQFIM